MTPADALRFMLPLEDYPPFSEWRTGQWHAIGSRSVPRLVAYLNAVRARASAKLSDDEYLWNKPEEMRAVAPGDGKAKLPRGVLELHYRNLRFRIRLAAGTDLNAPWLTASQVTEAAWSYRAPKARIQPERGPRKPRDSEVPDYCAAEEADAFA